MFTRKRCADIASSSIRSFHMSRLVACENLKNDDRRINNRSILKSKNKITFQDKGYSDITFEQFFFSFFSSFWLRNPHFPVPDNTSSIYPNTARTKDTASFEAFIGKANGIRRTSATVLCTLCIREYFALSQLCSAKEIQERSDPESSGPKL